MKRLIIFFTLSFYTLSGNAQSITFTYNGTSTSSYDNGSIQSWTVPTCVDTITITAVGGPGGTGGTGGPALFPGGHGALIKGKIAVTPGQVLNIMVGGQGQLCTINNAGGGGGASFVWDNATTTLFVAAGGGGGGGAYAGAPAVAGPGANGQTNNTSVANLETPTISTGDSCAPGGIGGGAASGGQAGLTTSGGALTSSDGGPGCGGAGWGQNGYNVGPGGHFYANGFGISPFGLPTPGNGGVTYSIGSGGYGGYGGGAGGGFNGGGGGGGYNGGGGGNGQPSNNAGWGGGGGGSYFNGTTADSTGLGLLNTNGFVTITWRSLDGLSANIRSTNITCNGANDGSITTNVTGGGAGPFVYSWTPNITAGTSAPGLSAGTYSVSVTDANGCVSSAAVNITQPAPLSVSTGSIVNTLCTSDSGGSALATAIGGTAPYTYVWAPYGGTMAAGTHLGVGIFTVTATDSNGCNATATATIDAINLSPIVSFAADTTKECAPLCTGFKDMSSVASGTIQSWYWNFGDGDTSHQKDPRDCYTTPGTYNVTLTVTSSLGCSSTLTMNNLINAYSYPIASFSYSPQSISILAPGVTFSDDSKDAYGIKSVLWTFGDATDSSSIVERPIHTYKDTGMYCPSLIVTNLHGCKDSVTHCLVVVPQTVIYIPDAFTPNDDGLNDSFAPLGSGRMSNFKMSIFNRWGILLYYTDDMSKGWNGTINNSGSIQCQQDTYVYNIDVTDNLGKNYSYIGKVTLLR
jgi:gliding motility-associated-like protein